MYLQRIFSFFLIFCGSTAFASGGQLLKGSFSNSFGSRGYELYVPEGQPENMPLIAVLHGCTMNPDQMVAGTQLNALADQRHFLVLYPQQTFQDNSSSCWNWFQPENLKRDSGELSILVGMVQKIVTDYKADPARVFTSGLSAGGAMSSNLLACYSDIFSGAMIGSGLAFDSAESLVDGMNATRTGSTNSIEDTAKRAFECSPSRTKPLKVMVFHGTSDNIVAKINADQATQQFDLVNRMILPNAQYNSSTTTIRGGNGKETAIETDFSYDGVVSVRQIEVQGMAHAWSGGSARAPYMDPNGPDASSMMVDFFLN